mgnify:FL=1
MTITRSPASFARVDVMASCVLSVKTSGAGFIDITHSVQDFVRECCTKSPLAQGLVHLFVRHTSASLTIQENADPDVLADLETALSRLAPEHGGWVHDAEGPDDMPAHIKTMLTSVSLSIPVQAGKLMLGTWQGIYLIEHRSQSHRRDIVLSLMGASQ